MACSVVFATTTYFNHLFIKQTHADGKALESVMLYGLNMFIDAQVTMNVVKAVRPEIISSKMGLYLHFVVQPCVID